jgi:hypothetical protein
MPTAVTLFAPTEFWRMPESERGGCGPGGVGDWFVPDTMYGLNIKPACSIHDFMYNVGEVEADRLDADEVLLNNLVRIIQATTDNKWLRWLRLRRAHTYYMAVRKFGGPAFWAGKNKPEEERTVMV